MLKSIRGAYPDLRHIFADGGYAGPKLREALEGIGNWTIQIVKRSDTAEGFEVIPRRWVGNPPHLWGCLKLELRGHFVLVQFHSGSYAADAHIGAVIVVSP